MFIMAIILFFRIVKAPSFSYTISEEETNNSLSWQSFTEKFNSTLDNLSDDWEEIKNEKEEIKNIFIENKDNVTSTDLIYTQFEGELREEDEEYIYNEVIGDYQDIEDVKKVTEEIIKKFNDTNNCPAWINCMPTIGTEINDCVIPSGCEDITQIAY